MICQKSITLKFPWNNYSKYYVSLVILYRIRNDGYNSLYVVGMNITFATKDRKDDNIGMNFELVNDEADYLIINSILRFRATVLSSLPLIHATFYSS